MFASVHNIAYLIDEIWRIWYRELSKIQLQR